MFILAVIAYISLAIALWRGANNLIYGIDEHGALGRTLVTLILFVFGLGFLFWWGIQ
jgi:hypothetical protein